MYNPRGSFNYYTLRSFIGLVAFIIPILTVMLYHISASPGSSPQLWPESISATYYLGAQNIFVGLLFVVAAFLLAYSGRGKLEYYAAKLAAACAMCVALFPTAISASWAKQNGFPHIYSLCEAAKVTNMEKCNLVQFEYATLVHYITAVALILTLIFFCYRFWRRTSFKLKVSELTEQIRSNLTWRKRCYGACALGMAVTACIGAWAFFCSTASGVIFWVELICLWLFGLAWLVAGKQFVLTESQEVEDKLSQKADELEEASLQNPS